MAFLCIDCGRSSSSTNSSNVEQNNNDGVGRPYGKQDLAWKYITETKKSTSEKDLYLFIFL